jgi:hypothetical protein
MGVEVEGAALAAAAALESVEAGGCVLRDAERYQTRRAKRVWSLSAERFVCCGCVVVVDEGEREGEEEAAVVAAEGVE